MIENDTDNDGSTDIATATKGTNNMFANTTNEKHCSITALLDSKSTDVSSTKSTLDNDTSDGTRKLLQPHPHDVMFGRGSRNHHGNHVFRALINKYKELYRNSPKHLKGIIAAGIVAGLSSDTRNPGGRFIDRDKNGWFVVNFKRSVEKTTQALREKFKPKVQERELREKREGYLGPDDVLEPTEIYIDRLERVIIPGKHNDTIAVGMYDNLENEKELERKRQLEKLEIDQEVEREINQLKTISK